MQKVSHLVLVVFCNALSNKLQANQISLIVLCIALFTALRLSFLFLQHTPSAHLQTSSNTGVQQQENSDKTTLAVKNRGEAKDTKAMKMAKNFISSHGYFIDSSSKNSDLEIMKKLSKVAASLDAEDIKNQIRTVFHMVNTINPEIVYQEQTLAPLIETYAQLQAKALSDRNVAQRFYPLVDFIESNKDLASHLNSLLV